LASSAAYGLFYNTIGWRGLLIMGVAPALALVYVRKYVKEPEVWDDAATHRVLLLRNPVGMGSGSDWPAIGVEPANAARVNQLPALFSTRCQSVDCGLACSAKGRRGQ